jgi:hypothetical protein
MESMNMLSQKLVAHMTGHTHNFRDKKTHEQKRHRVLIDKQLLAQISSFSEIVCRPCF